MIKSLLGFLLVVVLIAWNNDTGTDKLNNTALTSDTLTKQEKAEGWKLLFDGKTTNGWHKYGGGPAGSAWKIIDGAFYLDTSIKENGNIVGGGDITTDEDFDNFDLKLQWKISKNGNSGIIFYVNEDTLKYKNSYEVGPEMQILDNDGHEDGKILKHRSGDLYDLISCSRETVKPVGEWNDAEIKSLNGKLDLFLNGAHIVSTTMWDDNWNKMVARSKFKDWKGFASFHKGKICLQEHKCSVWFRDIKIKKL